MDFAKLVEVFDRHGVTFVSITQSFNTTTSMGRLTLNVLLSFAQFEREVTGERIRDKIAASKKKGMWMGGLCSGWLQHCRQEAGDRPRVSAAGADAV
jgi:site-specific DNA recombinase